jgi:hypothetical protein
MVRTVKVEDMAKAISEPYIYSNVNFFFIIAEEVKRMTATHFSHIFFLD